MLTLANAGNLRGYCPQHDQVALTREQQIEIAENWHDSPTKS
jgi:hypothetical protein